jgi:hypothetical protein
MCVVQYLMYETAICSYIIRSKPKVFWRFTEHTAESVERLLAYPVYLRIFCQTDDWIFDVGLYSGLRMKILTSIEKDTATRFRFQNTSEYKILSCQITFSWLCRKIKKSVPYGNRYVHAKINYTALPSLFLNSIFCFCFAPGVLVTLSFSKYGTRLTYVDVDRY